MSSFDKLRDSQDTGGRRTLRHFLLQPLSTGEESSLNATTENERTRLSAQGYVALIRDLAKSSGIYAISSVTSPLVSLVLAPFLTHSLSRTEYGALVVLNTVIALVAGITQFGLGSAFFRAYNYDYESRQDRLGVLSTVVGLLSLTTLPLAIAAVITAPWLAELLLRSSSFAGPTRLAVLVVLLWNLTVPGFAWLRAENRAGVFSTLSIMNLLIALAANVVLVGALHMGIAGSLLATGGSYAVVVICTLPFILLRAGLRFRLDITWNLLSFGLPLVFNSLAFWVLQLSDRYLLSRLGSLAQTASYAVAYSLGGVLNMLVLVPFMLAWPRVMFAIAKGEDAAHTFQFVFRWYSLFLLFATFTLSLIAILVLNILFPPAYHSAALIIPIIAISIMFYGVYIVFNAGVGIRRKNWYSVIFLALSALVNVGLNLILIPLYGSMGAAVSTLLAYTLLALTARIVNQRIYPIPFEIGRFIIALLVGIVLYTGASLLAQTQHIYAACAVYIATLSLYGGFLVFLGRLETWNHKNADQQIQEDTVS